MSDLQIGLAILGVIGVVAVIVYNRVQEARFRQRAESAFAGQDRDALMDSAVPRTGPGERIEPQLQPGAAPDATGPADRREPRAMPEAVAAAKRAAAPESPERSDRLEPPEPAQPATPASLPRQASTPMAPDKPQPAATTAAAQPEKAAKALVRGAAQEPSDPLAYTAEISASEPVPATALEQLLHAIGALAARLRLEGRQENGNAWGVMDRAAFGSVRQVRVSLQLVNRRGVVSNQDLVALQSAVARCAASLAANASIPEAEAFLTRARELDAFCAEVDVAVGINILAPRGRPFAGTRLRALAEATGFRLTEGGFVYPDGHNGVRFSMENQNQTRLSTEALRNLQTPAVTLVLDVPRQADGVAAFDQMVAVGQQLAQSLGGTLVDDNNVPVSEAGLEQIRNQLRAIYATMESRGIAPGGPVALRLFS